MYIKICVPHYDLKNVAFYIKHERDTILCHRGIIMCTLTGFILKI